MMGWGKVCLLLVFTLFTFRGSVCWNPAVVSHHYNIAASRGDLTHHLGLHYQALALNLPFARFNHYHQHSEWDLNQKLTWLSHQSLNKHWRAHWYKGQLWYQQQQLPRARLWYVSASELYLHNTEHVESESFTHLQLELAQVYIELMQFKEAIALLNSESLTHEFLPHALAIDVQYKLALIKLFQGEVISADSLLTVLLERFGVDVPPEIKQRKQQVEQLLMSFPLALNSSDANCLVKVQLLASDYQQWLFGSKIIANWQQHQGLTQIPLCFNQIQSIDPKIIHCVDQVGMRQSCDLTLMAKHLELADDVLPVIMHGRSGIANYNNGVVFVNQGNSFDIFVHELFHHFGFIDEYQVSPQIAQKLCSVSKPTFKGENLLIVPKHHSHKFLTSGHYTEVDTCNGTSTVAFKPLKQLTMMQFMDQNIPQLYIEKAVKRLKEKPERIANYQYAYALAFSADESQTDYQYWLNKSAEKGYYAAKMLFDK